MSDPRTNEVVALLSHALAYYMRLDRFQNRMMLINGADLARAVDQRLDPDIRVRRTTALGTGSPLYDMIQPAYENWLIEYIGNYNPAGRREPIGVKLMKAAPPTTGQIERPFDFEQ